MSTNAALEQALDDLATGRAPSAEGQGRAFLNSVVEDSRKRLIRAIQARARECPLLGVKQTSISSDLMSAISQTRTFIRAVEIQNQAIGRLRRADHYNGGAI